LRYRESSKTNHERILKVTEKCKLLIEIERRLSFIHFNLDTKLKYVVRFTF
jgi:hypothetical protein